MIVFTTPRNTMILAAAAAGVAGLGYALTRETKAAVAKKKSKLPARPDPAVAPEVAEFKAGQTMLYGWPIDLYAVYTRGVVTVPPQMAGAQPVTATLRPTATSSINSQAQQFVEEHMWTAPSVVPPLVVLEAVVNGTYRYRFAHPFTQLDSAIEVANPAHAVITAVLDKDRLLEVITKGPGTAMVMLTLVSAKRGRGASVQARFVAVPA